MQKCCKFDDALLQKQAKKLLSKKQSIYLKRNIRDNGFFSKNKVDWWSLGCVLYQLIRGQVNNNFQFRDI